MLAEICDFFMEVLMGWLLDDPWGFKELGAATVSGLQML